MNERANENSWIPLMVVACASFIIILDSLFKFLSLQITSLYCEFKLTAAQRLAAFPSGARKLRKTDILTVHCRPPTKKD